ncbi:peptide chain release factor 2 [bacterium]|nr:peptide chain release factor 2 [bacterium]
MSEIVENIEYELKDYLQTFSSIESIISPETLKVDIKKTENLFAEDPNIWSDPDKAAALNKQLQVKKQNLNDYNTLNDTQDELIFSLELFKDDADEDLIPEIQSVFARFQKLLKAANLKFLLNGEFDLNNAIITIHPGAGGTESCDWASMLLRMYQRLADIKGFKYKTLDYLAGEVAGVKSVTFSLEGDYAYGYMKSEMGVHRLVRISPFDSSGRRHTSFASVDVSPEIDDTIEIEILDKDIRVDTYCASGAGGQSVNTTYSAVRITHLESNLVVTCQNEKSQLSNRKTAMKVLQSRLLQLEMKKREKEVNKGLAEKMENSFGSQIRNYVLHPYQMVNDLRSNFKTTSADKVLDGDLEDIMLEYLKWLNNSIKESQENKS